jgi:hypothetical protein
MAFASGGWLGVQRRVARLEDRQLVAQTGEQQRDGDLASVGNDERQRAALAAQMFVGGDNGCETGRVDETDLAEIDKQRLGGAVFTVG